MPCLSTLSFGHDASLLATRGWVLSRAGFDTVSVSTLAECERELLSRHFDLLLFCHSLPRTDCEELLSWVGRHALPLGVLALVSGFNTAWSLAPSVLRVDTMMGPAHLSAALRHLCAIRFATELSKEIEMSQHGGQVRWFNNAKGYGFVGRNDGGDVFTHFSSIQSDGYKSLSEGDSVTLDIVQGEKGPQADQVRMVKKV